MESNPEPFKPHYCQLLQLLTSVLQDHNNPTALYYCIQTLTAITAYIGSAEMVRLHNCHLSINRQSHCLSSINNHRQDGYVFCEVLLILTHQFNFKRQSRHTAIVNIWRTHVNLCSVIFLPTEPDAFSHPKSDCCSETPHQSK